MKPRRSLTVALLPVVAACGVAPDPGATGLTDPALKPAVLSACPSIARSAGAGRCVLDGDARITATIELGDSMTLDCQGHQLLPARAAEGTSATSYVPSLPEVAVAILGGSNATLSNCVLGSHEEPFDFTIIVAGTPEAPATSNRISGNSIHARSFGVKVIASSGNQIVNNDISWGAGIGVVILRNSDRNHVVNNRFRLNEDLTFAFARDNPGIAAEVIPSLRNVGLLVMNMITSTTPNLTFGLTNVVVNGRLLQWPDYDGSSDACGASCPGYGRLEDTKITGNQLSLPNPNRPANTGGGIYVGALVSRTIVRDNEVREAGQGIRLAGFSPTQQVHRPGHCVRADGSLTDRRCDFDADCFIPPVDAEPLGACPTLAERPIDVIDAQAQDTLVEHNRLYGPFNDPRPFFRAGVVGGNATIRGVIRENLIEGTGTETGISMQGHTIMTGTVVGNRISGVRTGLLLSTSGATFFGARVSGNDIVGSTLVGIGTEGTYILESELSADGVGNFWGRTEEPCFRATDSSSPASLHDSHPSCTPVAPVF
jgi:nitrous oxidase accessory protein NosD